MKRRVVFFPRWNDENPATRLRANAFAAELGRRGFSASVEPSLVPVRWDARFDAAKPLVQTAARFLRALNRLGPGDVAYLVRLEKMPAMFPLVAMLAKRRGFRTVYDMDEAIYLTHPVSTLGLLAFSDAVVVAGRALERTACRWAKRVERIPTPVEMDLYPAKAIHDPSRFVVGFSGTPSNVRLLSRIAGPLRRAAARVPMSLRVITRPDAHVPNILGPRQSMVPWTLADYRRRISELDVGLMVVPDTAWWRAKMGYKLVEYQACGVPGLGSRVLEPEKPIIDGETGFYASTPAEWEEALVRLGQDPHLRRRLGANARRWADEEYSLRRAGERLQTLLETL